MNKARIHLTYEQVIRIKHAMNADTFVRLCIHSYYQTNHRKSLGYDKNSIMSREIKLNKEIAEMMEEILKKEFERNRVIVE